MSLAGGLGLVAEDLLPDDEETKAEWYLTLVGACRRMLTANVHVDWKDFCNFTKLEQEALLEAGEVVSVKQAVRTGLSMNGYAPEVLADVDDGDALVKKELNSLLDEVTK